MTRQHYTPDPAPRDAAGIALAVAIGLALAVLLVRYL